MVYDPNVLVILVLKVVENFTTGQGPQLQFGICLSQLKIKGSFNDRLGSVND